MTVEHGIQKAARPHGYEVFESFIYVYCISFFFRSNKEQNMKDRITCPRGYQTKGM